MQFTGIEIQPEEADRANRSVRMNGQQERIRFIMGDIREADGLIPPASFDIVTANPPYMSAGAGLTGPNKARMIARHEILCTIADVTGAAARALRPGGLLYMVHRPHRLEDIAAALRSSNLALRCLRTVHPYADREANLLLVEAVKGGGTNVRVEPPLILYSGKGESTEELRRIYSD
jgi:tRNA1Val (adenine37-N6)-methyltransferase